MYLNTIKFKTSKVCIFITSEECFTPQNPVYAAVQKVLVEMGYEQECNHRFNGCMGDLKFTYEEIEIFNPFSNTVLVDRIKENRQHLGGATGFIVDLEYVFTAGAKTEEDVRTILTPMNI